MTHILHTLAERSKTHGDFLTNSVISQTLKLSLRARDGWEDLSASQREAIEMICHKLGRILAGNSNFEDHWRDIAGYATLIANQLLEPSK